MSYRGTYKGKINPSSLKNPKKYVGDISNIVYRSMWERNVVYWLDDNPNVSEWASEEIAFPYEHPIDNRRAKYYPDFFVKMIDGTMRVIEVKPKKETQRPLDPKRKTQKHITAVATWIVNNEKWLAARYFCEKNNMKFEIWTEDTLTEMGIMKSATPQIIAESKGPKMKPVATKKPPRPRPKRKS